MHHVVCLYHVSVPTIKQPIATIDFIVTLTYLKRGFVPQSPAQFWVADITYPKCQVIGI
jgi:hypothetical protein